MKKLSKKEWIGVVVAIVFVAYTLFGGNIMSIFQNLSTGENGTPSVDLVTNNGNMDNTKVIVNDIVVGSGEEIKSGNMISVHYALSLSDGTLVQNSKDFGTPFQFVFGAGEVIPGWEQGLSGMKVGGVRTIVIPPDLAYGASQAGPIPPNSTLIFTVELVGISSVPASSQSAQ